MKFNQNDETYVKGMQSYLSGDWEEAAKNFTELKKKNKESTFIPLLLGDIYYSLGRLEEAMENYRQSLEVNPEYCIVYYKMGVCTYRSGKLEEALKYFKSARKYVCSTDAMICYYIGLINYFLGNDRESIENFEILKKESDESKIANYYLAQLRLKNNEFDEAIVLLEELLEITPTFAEIYYLLGNAYYKKHDVIKAIKCIRKAVELDPDDKRSQVMLELLTVSA